MNQIKMILDGPSNQSKKLPTDPFHGTPKAKYGLAQLHTQQLIIYKEHWYAAKIDVETNG